MKSTEAIAEFVRKTSLKEIPNKAIDNAKKCILDCIGVTVAGSVDTTGKTITHFIKEMGGESKASVVCGGFRTSAPNAAFANGVMAHALDYDDNFESITGHPSTVLLPAVLALGEKYEVSGENVLEAYILGLETEAKIGSIINRKDYYQGWHSTGTLGTLGAAVACAKIIGLNIEQTKMALGIAASSSCGLRQNFGTMTKPFHAGNAARSGVIAAMLAERGFTANKEILESPFGYFNLFGGGGKYKLDNISKLGNPFELILPGLWIKPYPSCGATHRCLDAILYMINKYNINAEMVDSVECFVHPRHPLALTYSRPKTVLEAKFSMEFCMAIALLDKRVGLEQFTDEKVLHPKTQDLLKRVKLSVLSGVQWEDESVGLVEIKSKDGHQYSHRIDAPEGSPKRPLTREKLIKKYENCCALVLPKRKINQSIDIVENLGKLRAITKLLDLIR